VLIVENKVNLLTLPRLPGTLAIGGLGNAVMLLRYCAWLGSVSITYWGDIDVQGFEILSRLRGIPEVVSMNYDRSCPTPNGLKVVLILKRKTCYPITSAAICLLLPALRVES
jgi:hypothetical protein